MAKACLNGFDVDACFDQRGCMRMSEIVQSARDTDLATDALPRLGDVVGVK